MFFLCHYGMSQNFFEGLILYIISKNYKDKVACIKSVPVTLTTKILYGILRALQSGRNS